LNVTIALIGWGEKPQLSPRPAVVFSKKTGAVYDLRADARVFGATRNRIARPSEIRIGPVFKRVSAVRPQRSRRRDAAKALFCRIDADRSGAAHICGKPD